MARNRLLRCDYWGWLCDFCTFDFPPTQRFGLVVLGGTAIDIAANLFLLPLLGGAELGTQEQKSGRAYASLNNPAEGERRHARCYLTPGSQRLSPRIVIPCPA